MKTSIKPHINPFDTNTAEVIRDAGFNSVKAVGESIKKDLLQEGGEDFISQLLGIERSKDQKTSGELKEGEELILGSKKTEKKVHIEPAMNYANEIIHAETTIRRTENGEMRAQMDQLRIEIAKLAKSSRELQVSIKDINIDTIPQTPGKLHVNFFEWILLQLKAVRIRVENSASWLSALTGKRNKKDFWSLAKSQGTSFSQSGERAVAQQTG